MNVIIMSGVSGSGKSTVANTLGMESPGSFKVVSADNFFMLNGEYVFRAGLIGHAHADCFREFVYAMQDKVKTVIVDNTNTTEAEIAPYVLGAAAFDYACEIHSILVVGDVDLQKCVVRNAHKVPAGSIIAQQDRMLKRRLPRYWKHYEMVAKF